MEIAQTVISHIFFSLFVFLLAQYTVKMSNSGINFKAYLVDGENSEVKRFFVDNDIVTSYVFMEEKLKNVFPSLRNCDLRINWKDTDGDLISISNDEDFITALTEMNYNPKVLYINTASKAPSSATPQFRVFCDVCQNGISGYRYKCIECPDYDLCGNCESSGNHSEHMVLRIPNSNTSIPKLDRKMLYNAARALKKTAVQAHKCAKEGFRTGDKEKQSRGENAGTSTQTPTYGCPFAAADMNQLITQNISSFAEMLSKAAPCQSSQSQGASTAQKPVTPNTLSDLINSVLEAFTVPLNTGPSATSDSTKAPATSTNTNGEPSNGKPADNNEKTSPNTQSQPITRPSAPTAGQEMEWTIVNEKDEDAASQISSGSKTPNAQIPQSVQPPQPLQDPRLMRGLAQLHEMGFSNENNFLNYLLELHEYNVDSVVKAILQLK